MTQKKKCNLLKKIDGLYFDAGYRKFKIVVTDHLSDTGCDCWGITDFDDCIISLQSTANTETAIETILHEITHVLLEVCGFGGHEKGELGDNCPEGYIPNASNEFLTLGVSRGFMSALNLNQELFKIILERKE